MKEISLYKMSYFPKPCTFSKCKIKVELDLSNYARKYWLKMQEVLIDQNLLKILI